MTETKRFLYIEALNDHDGSGTDPEYYQKEFCWFTFIGRDSHGIKRTLQNYYYHGYDKATGEYTFMDNGGNEVKIRRNERGGIDLMKGGLRMTVDDILLTEENDTRHENLHQMTAGKRRKRKRRAKKRTKKRRYF
jgi:hypothetical protein